MSLNFNDPDGAERERIDVEALKARLVLSDVVRGRGVELRRKGRELVGKCPFHAERSASFTVVDAKRWGHCFGCGWHGDAIAFVMAIDNIDFLAAVEALGGPQQTTEADRERGRRQRAEADERERRVRKSKERRAAERWAATRPAAGTPVEAYLRGRGIDIEAIGGMPADLRYAEVDYLWYRDDAYEGEAYQSLGRFPAMVGAIRQTDTNAVEGIHVTYLAPDGRGGWGKAHIVAPDGAVQPSKKMFGSMTGGAIRLGTAGGELLLGEGVETCLSVLSALRRAGVPGEVWSAGSLSSFSGGSLGRGPRRLKVKEGDRHTYRPSPIPDPARPGVRLPAVVDRLIWLGDSDGKDPLDGKLPVERGLARCRAEGLKAVAAWAPAAQDFNNQLVDGDHPGIVDTIRRARAALDGPPPGGPHWRGATQDREASLAEQAAAIDGCMDHGFRVAMARREIEAVKEADVWGLAHGLKLKAEADKVIADLEAMYGEVGGFDPGVDEAIYRGAFKHFRTRWPKDAGDNVDSLYDTLLRRLERRARLAERREILRRHGLKNLAGPRLLVTGVQGSGKTRRVIERLREMPRPLVAHVLQPTLEKAMEFAADYARNAGPDSVSIRVLRGRGAPDPDAEEEGDTMCRRAAAAELVAKAGLPVYELLCRKDERTCPYFKGCAYLRQVREVQEMEEAGAIFAMSHAYAFVPAPSRRRDLVVVDESIIDDAIGTLSFSPAKIAEASSGWAKRGGVSQGEKLADAEEYRATAAKVAEALTEHPSRELARLREVGVDAQPIGKARTFVAGIIQDNTVDGVSPDADDDDILAALDRVDRSDLPKVLTLFRALLAELQTGRDGLNSVVYRTVMVRVEGGSEPQWRVFVSFVKAPDLRGDAPLLCLDGTGDIMLNRAVWGDRMEEARIAIERDAEVIQVSGKRFSRQSLTGCSRKGAPIGAKGEASSERLRREVAEVIAAQPGPAFVAATMQVEEVLKPLLPGGTLTAHFSALRGLNRFQDCPTAVVVGREQMKPIDLETDARAFAATDAEPFVSTVSPAFPAGQYVTELRARRMRDGTVEWEEVEVHPDPRAQRLLEQAREAEIIQAVDRVRAVFNRRRLVILTDVVVDITVDRSTTWKDLVSGGDRFEQAFARTGRTVALRCDGELSRCFPDLFPTPEAAKKAQQRTGLRGDISQISILFGKCPPLGVAYRRGGQPGSASRALIAGDVPDPRAALEAVTGPVVSFVVEKAEGDGAAEADAALAADAEMPGVGIPTPAASEPVGAADLTKPEMAAAAVDTRRGGGLILDDTEAPRCAPELMLLPWTNDSGTKENQSGDAEPWRREPRLLILVGGALVGLEDALRQRRTAVRLVSSPLPAEPTMAASPFTPAEAARLVWEGNVARLDGCEVGRIGVAGWFVPRADYWRDDALWPSRASASAWAGVRPANDAQRGAA